MNERDDIKKMILDHIEQIDEDLKEVKESYAGRTHYSRLEYAGMYKAKSLALQALAELKNGYEG